MSAFVENIIRGLWNAFTAPSEEQDEAGLSIGYQVIEDKVSGRKILLPHSRRTEQVSVVGVTGSGKTSLLRLCTREDVSEERGWLFFDLHGDTTPYLLSMIAAEEQRRGRDLSRKLIVISPADQEFAVGMNFLEQDGTDIFVQIAEITAILKKRFLETAGARTEELLRNTLYVLAANRTDHC
jgi:DNA helicase HerA-like ATPase